MLSPRKPARHRNKRLIHIWSGRPAFGRGDAYHKTLCGGALSRPIIDANWRQLLFHKGVETVPCVKCGERWLREARQTMTPADYQRFASALDYQLPSA
jgi:hypothetical protein